MIAKAALGDTAFLFADGVKIAFPRSQSSRLLSSLSSALALAEDLDVPISPYPCSRLTVGNLLLPLSPSFSTTNANHQILQVTCVRGLGAPLDTTFASSVHCRVAADRAKRSLFMARRSFCELSKIAFILLYCVIVRPNPEYAMEAKALTRRADINQHECVLRLATPY